MFGQKKDAYGNPYNTGSRRRSMIVLIIVIVSILGLGILVIVNLAHRSQTKSAQASLIEYDDPLFTIKYPDSYVPFIDDKVTFKPQGQQSSELIQVASSYPYETGFTIDNIDKFFSLGKNTETIKTQKSKSGSIDICTFIESTEGDTETKTVYFFYPGITWTVSVAYLPGGALSKQADAIITSFQPKLVKERDIPDEQLPTRDSSVKPIPSEQITSSASLGALLSVGLAS